MQPLPKEIWQQIVKNLPTNDVFRIQLVNKQIYQSSQSEVQKRSPEILQSWRYHSKQLICDNIKLVMDLARRDILPDSYQQLWAFEMAIKCKDQDYVDIIKSKFTLVPQMFNICIRLIQSVDDETVREMSAKFMLYLDSKGIKLDNLPDSIEGKTADEIIGIWVPVNEQASYEFVEILEGWSVYGRWDEETFESCQEHLIEYGGHVHVNYGLVLLVFDFHRFPIEFVRYLIQLPGTNVNMVNTSNCTPLYQACRYCYVAQYLELLLSHPEIDVNHSPLGYDAPMIAAFDSCAGASRSELETIVELLLRQPGVNVNCSNHLGESALILALGSDSALQKRTNLNSLEIVRLLLEHPSADKKHLRQPICETGETPMMRAIKNGWNEPVIELLLEHGFDPNECDYQGDTALIYACRRGYLPIIEVLLEHPQINIHHENIHFETAFAVAEYKPDVLTLLNRHI